MARIPEIIRRGNISQVSTHVPKAGDGWAALADIAKAGADFVRPAAHEQAREEGLKAVYRDESGALKVRTKSAFGGELADVHNTAAHAKFLSQRSIDISETFTELATQHQHDPAEFKRVSDLYVQSLRAEEGVPTVLKEEIALTAEREANARFNGLDRQRVQRDQDESNRNTKTQRDMLADDYVNLLMGGDVEAAQEKYAELERISDFRREAPYISETPAETEAYMRGVRGSAKAAQLTQKLEGLIGRDDLSDAERTELEGLLSDPDLDPGVRARLRVAVNGRLKGIEANGIAKGLTDGTYEGRIISAESSGNNAAANPNSTALGPHQFLKGTWLGLIKDHQPEWAKGLSTTELLGLRKDRAKSSEMFAHFRAQNQSVLSEAGLPINHATEYLAHFFGAGTAVNVLSADPNAQVSDLVPASVIKANPFLKNMTVSDVQNWSARKMTMKASDIAAQQVVIDQIEDTEIRAMASRALTDQFQVRNRYENAAAAEYETRLVASDDTLTNQEILEDHNLSDGTQLALIKKLNKAREDQIEIQKTVSDLNDETVNFDIYDTKDRNRVNKAYEASLEGASPSEPEHAATGIQMAARTGAAPKAAFNDIRAGLKSDDPAIVARSAELANQYLEASPTAFAPHGGSKEVLGTVSDYKQLAPFHSGEEAAQTLIDRRADRPKNVTDQAKEMAKDVSLSHIKDHFDDWFLDSPTLGSPVQEEQMLSELQMLFKDEYLKDGNFDAALNRSLDQFGRIYGPNIITGDKRVMRYPPQSVYHPINKSYDWMTDQIEKEVSEHLYGTDARKNLTPMDRGNSRAKRKWVDAESIKLVSDAQTKGEVDRGIPPSYVVYYTDKDGMRQQFPQRFFFDPKDEKSDFDASNNAEYDARREEAIRDTDNPNRVLKNKRFYRYN